MTEKDSEEQDNGKQEPVSRAESDPGDEQAHVGQAGTPPNDAPAEQDFVKPGSKQGPRSLRWIYILLTFLTLAVGGNGVAPVLLYFEEKPDRLMQRSRDSFDVSIKWATARGDVDEADRLRRESEEQESAYRGNRELGLVIRQIVDSNDEDTVTKAARESVLELLRLAEPMLVDSYDDQLARTWAYLLVGEHEQAVSSASGIVKRFGRRPEALNILGISKLRMGHNSDALDLFDEILRSSDNETSAILGRAAALNGLGRFDEALAVCDMVLEQDGRNARAALNRSHALGGKSQFREALAAAEYAIELAPTSWEAHNNRAAILLRLGRPEDAQRAVDRALELNPFATTAHIIRGATLYNRGRHKEAIETLRLILKKKPSNLNATVNLSIFLAQEKEFDEALKLANRAIAIAPTATVGYTALGTVLGLQNQGEEALAAFQQAMELDSESFETHGNLVGILVRLGRGDDAVVAGERAVQMFPESKAMEYNLAIALHLSGRNDEAIAMFTKVFEGAPGLRTFAATDPDLATLRPNPRFQMLLNPESDGGPD